MVYLGVVVGALVIVLAYLSTMRAYFHFKRRNASAKFRVELSVLAFAILISVVAKLIIMLQYADKTIEHGSAALFYAIYAGIGELSFEGVGKDIEDGFHDCIYLGSTLYAGLVALSLLATFASYEIYSFYNLSMLKFSRFREETDYFIFMAVTEDTVLLAESIENEYEHGTQKGRKYKTIFAGDISPFDGKNQLHRRIMTNGYLYYSYSQDNSVTYKSVVKILKLWISNAEWLENGGKKPDGSRVHIFAMALTGALRGNENANSETIFNEIGALVRESISRNKKMLVNYYLLSDTDINYEYYQDAVKARILEGIRESGSQISTSDAKNFDALISEYEHYFQLNVINEAAVAADCLLQKRIDLLSSEDILRSKDEESWFTKSVRPDNQNNYKALVLGFGKNGQYAMKTAFQAAAYVNENGVPSQFIADVFDDDADKISGLFAHTHPLFVCERSGDPFAQPSDAGSLFSEEQKTRLREIYATEIKNEITIEQLAESIKFPYVSFRSASGFDIDFSKFLNESSGDSNGVKNKFGYDFLLIALGDSEANVAMANSLLADIKHEKHEDVTIRTGGRTLFIAVNVRDEKTGDRIDWTDADRTDFPNIKVIVFGGKKEIYSYRQIIDDTADMRYHYGYKVIADKFANDLEDALLPDNREKNYTKLLNDITSAQDGESDYRKKWFEVPLFLKASSRAAADYRHNFLPQLENDNALNGYLLARLAQIEHIRWNRFMISNGWTYTRYAEFSDKTQKDREKKRRQKRKEHNCILASNMLSSGIQTYDLVNVCMAYALMKTTSTQRRG